MAGNRGSTSLRMKRRREDPMREFDRLPAELRAWCATALLPWRPRSVLRAFNRALSQGRDIPGALDTLTRLERRQVARDTRNVWGTAHPFANTDTERRAPT